MPSDKDIWFMNTNEATDARRAIDDAASVERIRAVAETIRATLPVVSTPAPSEPTARYAHVEGLPPKYDPVDVAYRAFDESMRVYDSMDVEHLTIVECRAMDVVQVLAGEYVRLRPALDALAAAVKGCDAELPDGTLCGEYDFTRTALCLSCEGKVWSAITAILDGRRPDA